MKKGENIMERNEVIEKLVSSPAVSFQFKKEDGSIRNAIGTLSPLVSGVVEDAANLSASAGNVINYFDVVKNHYRSFDLSRLTQFDGVTL